MSWAGLVRLEKGRKACIEKRASFLGSLLGRVALSLEANR